MSYEGQKRKFVHHVLPFPAATQCPAVQTTFSAEADPVVTVAVHSKGLPFSLKNRRPTVEIGYVLNFGPYAKVT
jgi:hypothetical protein